MGYKSQYVEKPTPLKMRKAATTGTERQRLIKFVNTAVNGKTWTGIETFVNKPWFP